MADASENSIGRYLATRLSTLKPPMNKAPNPFKTLALLNRQQWVLFMVRIQCKPKVEMPWTKQRLRASPAQIAFWAWTWDAFDFFTVSVTVTSLAETFGKKNSDITWGITLVLMLRSVGAITFGIASDRYGRKWPFIVNNILFIVLELATGFCQTYQQFLACRALFGIAMGGLYGNVAATALEDCPQKARGMISGMLQQGYAFGYLLATAFGRALVNTTPHGWRPLFWFGACPPVIFIVIRYFLPETNAYRSREQVRKGLTGGVAATFISEGKVALRRHWLLMIYLVLLMTGFNFMVSASDFKAMLRPNQQNQC